MHGDLATVAGLWALTVIGALLGRRRALRQGAAQRFSQLLAVAPSAAMWTMAVALILALGDSAIGPARLLGSSALLTGVWLLSGAGAVAVLARGFSRWETSEHSLILVQPLHAGQPKAVYFRASLENVP